MVNIASCSTVGAEREKDFNFNPSESGSNRPHSGHGANLADNPKSGHNHADTRVDWYGRLGYCFIEHAQWTHTNYRSVIMSKALR